MEKVLNMTAAIIVEDNIWFSADEFNGLFCWNIHTKETKFMGRFPNERDQLKLHVDICKVDELLIFVPYCGKNIQIYDMKTQKFRTIKMPKPQLKNGEDKTYQCSGGYVLGSDIYLFPFCYCDPIIKLNPYTEKIGIISVDSDIYSKISGVTGSSSFIHKNQNIYSMLFCQNGILKVDTCSGVCDVITLKNQKSRYQSICKVSYNNCVYIWTEDNELIECDLETFSVINVYHVSGKKKIIIKWVNIDNMIYGLDCIEGSIIMFDAEKKVINVLDIKEKCMPREYDFPGKLGMNFWGILSDNKFLYVLPEKYYEIVCIPLHLGISEKELEMHNIKMPYNFDYNKYILNYISDTDIFPIVEEELTLTLDIFIEYVCRRKESNKRTIKPQ